MSALRSEGLSAGCGVGDFRGAGDGGRGGEGAACCGCFSGSGLEVGGNAERFSSGVSETLDFPAFDFGTALAGSWVLLVSDEYCAILQCAFIQFVYRLVFFSEDWQMRGSDVGRGRKFPFPLQIDSQ